jgi:hypothetical protein
MNLRWKGLGVSFLGLVFGIILFASCGKDKESPYKLTMSGTGALLFDWTSDKVDGAILNDTLLIAAQKNDKSKVVLIISRSEPGDYEISEGSIAALATFDLVGDNKPENKFLSTDGVISILEKDTKNKVVTGFFSFAAVSGSLEEVTVEGNFISKYRD